MNICTLQYTCIHLHQRTLKHPTHLDAGPSVQVLSTNNCIHMHIKAFTVIPHAPICANVCKRCCMQANPNSHRRVRVCIRLRCARLGFVFTRVWWLDVPSSQCRLRPVCFPLSLLDQLTDEPLQPLLPICLWDVLARDRQQV